MRMDHRVCKNCVVFRISYADTTYTNKAAGQVNVADDNVRSSRWNGQCTSSVGHFISQC